MKEENLKLPRMNVEDYPADTGTETDKLIEHIIRNTSQVSVSKSDEISVMQSMLNDKKFEVALYDRTRGYLGTRSPRETALSMINDALCGVTGMSQKEATELSRDYIFSKRDAARQVSLAKDFIGTYIQSGRKVIVMSDPRGEASINLRYVKERDKKVPDANNNNIPRTIKTPAKIKLVASNKSTRK